MSFRKSRPITPAKLAANRQNAQKSTGPRTVAGKRRASMNNFQHGLYARLNSRRRKTLEELREDPAEFEQLQQDLVAAWKPVDAMQALVVSDLAGLYWKKMQLENSSLNARLREKQCWDGDAEDRQLQAERLPENLGMIVTNSGFRGAVHSKTCFEQACRLLDEINEFLEDHQRLEPITEDLYKLFGEASSRRGREMFGLFKLFAADKDGADPSLGAELKRLVVEERASVKREHELAQRRKQLTLRESKRSIWEPGTRNWNLILKGESDLDNEIAQKVKLMIQLKSLPQAEEEPECSRESEPESGDTGKSSNPGNEPEN